MKKYKSYFLLHTNIALILLLSSLSFLNSCRNKNYSSQLQYQFNSTNQKPHYSDLNYWAAHPWKKDLSDSIPKPLRATFQQDSTTDVFFIHPTTLTVNSDPRWTADIDDPELNAKTDYSSILYQASVFNEKCRVFAPRYRQAHYNSFFIGDSIAKKYFDLAYADIRAAFEYYLANYNNGRPIIIAAHSQGTKHAGRLLKEFFEEKPLLDKLVCAYIIGLPIPEDYFKVLPPCKDSLSTGCFVGWRTYKSGYLEPNYVAKENFKTVVINPLSWTSDTLFYNSSYNLGGVLKKFNRIVPQTVSAQVHSNVLWASKPNVAGKIFFTKKNYHIGDINLFYMNIRQNVSTRIAAYWKTHSRL